MRKDTECGISFSDWEEFQVGDKIQCYEEKFEERKF
jgi:translation initiation factor IF-2